MKIILKLSMICGLLVSMVGTVEAARQDAPGVAIRKAMSGNFDDSEINQLLRDLPEEWKKGHKKIVNQIRSGARARNAKKSAGIVEEDSSGMLDLIDDEKTKQVEEEIQKINSDLEVVITIVRQLDNLQKKTFANPKDFMLDSSDYSENYKIVVDYYNKMLAAFSSSTVTYFLANLAQLSESGDKALEQCFSIVKYLQEWNSKVGNNKKITELLSMYNKRFGGGSWREQVGMDKPRTDENMIVNDITTQKVLKEIEDKLEAYLSRKYIVPQNGNWTIVRDSINSKHLLHYMINKTEYAQEYADLIELSNKIITRIDNCEENHGKDSFGEFYEDFFKNIENLFEKLKAIPNPNQDIKNVCMRIFKQLETWVQFRIGYLAKEKKVNLTTVENVDKAVEIIGYINHFQPK